MLNKRIIPILTTVLILMAGGVLLFSMHSHWKDEQVEVDTDVVDRVNEKPDGAELKTIIHQAEKNVMLIEGQNDNQTITGSGFLYNEQGDIITNAHVVEDADIIYVRTASAHVYPAAVIGTGEGTDVAVIRVPQLAGKSYMDIEESEKAEVGDEVIALGSPHGFQNTVTPGIISGAERNFVVDGYDYENAYQISAQITHGNSGGPLIKRSTGNVIGINSVGTEDGTLGFSIPIHDVIDTIHEWSEEAQNDELDIATIDDIETEVEEDEFMEDTKYIIDYFFENITIRDYIGAYTLLGSSKQSDTSYSDFREKYIHLVDLDYSGLDSTLNDDRLAETTVDVTIESKGPDTEDKTEKEYVYTFTTGYENDQMHILDISRTEKESG